MVGVVIRLTFAEVQQGTFVGCQRQVENLKNNRQPAHGCGRDNDWQIALEGALGEMALAKHLGLFWSKGVLGGTDVGDVQVRTTPYSDGRLRAHRKDNDAQRYYLLTGINGVYTAHGWLLGGDCKQEKYWGDLWKTGRPAFWVPQSDLNPL